MKKRWFISIILILVVSSAFVLIKNKNISKGFNTVEIPISHTADNAAKTPNTLKKSQKYLNGEGRNSYKKRISNTKKENNNCNNPVRIQYALRDFINNAVCLKNGTMGCNKIKMICSVNVCNLDSKVGGNFNISYILKSGDKKIDSKIIEKNIGADNKSILEVEFIEDIPIDPTSLRCIININNVPKTC